MSSMLAGKAILCLEDEPLVAMQLEDTLRDAGCDVVGPFYSADDALQAIAIARVDGAVLDVNLGTGQTSARVADTLRERGIPFIYATGYATAGLRPVDRAVLRVEKPYQSSQVLKALTASLAEGIPRQRSDKS